MSKVIDLNIARQNREASRFLKDALEVLSQCDFSVFSYDSRKLKLVDSTK